MTSKTSNKPISHRCGALLNFFQTLEQYQDMEEGDDSAKLMQNAASGADLESVSVSVFPSSKKAETHPHHRKYSAYIEPTADVQGSVLSLVNSTVGSGMLGLPYAFSKSGWALGTILMTLSAVVTMFGLDILAACALRVPQPPNLFDVADLSMPYFAGIVDIAVVILSFGGCTSYLMVIADLMPPVIDELGGSTQWQRRTVWVCIGFAVIAPLTCFRSLKALEYTAALSIVFTLFITLVIALFSCQIDGLDPCADSDDCVGNKENVITTYSTVRTLPIFIFAFACHTNIFPITAELKGASLPRLDKIIVSTMAIIYIVYMIIAVSGYQTYGDKVNPNILVSYPRHPLVTVARIFVALLVACCYPLSINPGRKVILAILAHLDPEDIEITERVLLIRFAAVTIIFLGVTLAVALSVSDISIVLSVVGSTGSTIVGFILPGFAYYVFYQNDGPSWKRTAALCLGCLGLIIMPVCLAFNFV